MCAYTNLLGGAGPRHDVKDSGFQPHEFRAGGGNLRHGASESGLWVTWKWCGLMSGLLESGSSKEKGVFRLLGPELYNFKHDARRVIAGCF